MAEGRNTVSAHYGGDGDLAKRIEETLRRAGIDPGELLASDFEPVDEFHFRGRAATLELLGELGLVPGARVLDIGSGLGGLARAIAEASGCHVTGADLTPEFCRAATAISSWVGLRDRTDFVVGNASDLPFPDHTFDAAVTVHVAMNIPDKEGMYAEAKRILKPGALFGVYDILQGEGGDLAYPMPWAADASVSHMATPEEMRRLLAGVGFRILGETDSTEASYRWLKDRAQNPGAGGILPPTTRLLFGDVSDEMTQNQLVALRERRMLTFSFICEVRGP